MKHEAAEIENSIRSSLLRISHSLDEQLKSETHLELNRLRSELEAERAASEQEIKKLKSALSEKEAGRGDMEICRQELEEAKILLASERAGNEKLLRESGETKESLEKANARVKELEQLHAEFLENLNAVLSEIDLLQENE